MDKLRQNIVTGEWVVISPERSKRPEDYVFASAPKSKVLPMDCPFCLDNNSAYQFSIKEAETKNIYVIPNKYPAFVKDDTIIEEGDDLYEDCKSIGGHEVVILKNHQQDIFSDGKETFNELIDVYKKRYLHFAGDPAVQYTMIIHNHGPEAGASIEHPHSQIFASAILPSYIDKEITGSKKYYEENQRCVFCDIAQNELKSQRRLIYENDDFIVFTFFAARFPFEFWIMSKKHSSKFEEISAKSQDLLADALHKGLDKLNKSLNFPPFNFWIHTLPHRMDDLKESYHWHLEVAPRVSKFGGYELGSGVVIDVVSPEVAAQFLKKS